VANYFATYHGSIQALLEKNKGLGPDGTTRLLVPPHTHTHTTPALTFFTAPSLPPIFSCASPQLLNSDETGFHGYMPTMNKIKVIVGCENRELAYRETSAERSHVTVLPVSGVVMSEDLSRAPTEAISVPPLIVYSKSTISTRQFRSIFDPTNPARRTGAGKQQDPMDLLRIKPEFRPKPWEFFLAANKSGHVNGTIVFNYFKVHVIPDLRRQGFSKNEWIILVWDMHGTHIMPDLLAYFISEKIMPHYYPAHATHKLQPQDVTNFTTLKGLSRKIFDHWNLALSGAHQQLKEEDFPWVVAPAYAAAFTDKLILKSFAVAALAPFHPDKVLNTFPGSKLYNTFVKEFKEATSKRKAQAIKAASAAAHSSSSSSASSSSSSLSSSSTASSAPGLSPVRIQKKSTNKPLSSFMPGHSANLPTARKLELVRGTYSDPLSRKTPKMLMEGHNRDQPLPTRSTWLDRDFSLFDFEKEDLAKTAMSNYFSELKGGMKKNEHGQKLGGKNEVLTQAEGKKRMADKLKTKKKVPAGKGQKPKSSTKKAPRKRKSMVPVDFPAEDAPRPKRVLRDPTRSKGWSLRITLKCSSRP
jgi:hypothetical protein